MARGKVDAEKKTRPRLGRDIKDSKEVVPPHVRRCGCGLRHLVKAKRV